MQANNAEKLIKCFDVLNHYQSLECLIEAMPEGSSLLWCLEQRFYAFGVTKQAVDAYLYAEALHLRVCWAKQRSARSNARDAGIGH